MFFAWCFITLSIGGVSTTPDATSSVRHRQIVRQRGWTPSPRSALIEADGAIDLPSSDSAVLAEDEAIHLDLHSHEAGKHMISQHEKGGEPPPNLPSQLVKIDAQVRSDQSAVASAKEAAQRAVMEEETKAAAASATLGAENERIARFCLPMNWMLLCAIGAGFYGVGKEQLQHINPAAGLSSLGVFVLAWYCFFSVSHTFFQHMTAQVKLNPIVPTILIYLFKLIIALAMYRYCDGTFQQLISTLKSNKTAMLWYLLPAACLAFYDLLSFLSLARVTPAVYQVLLHLRTVVIAFVWQLVMSKRLTATQWALLCSCIYAVLMVERKAVASLIVGNSFATTLWPYLTLFMQYGLSVTGNISNEKLLKEIDMSINAQNVIMYTWGATVLSIALAVVSVVQGPLVHLHDLPLVFDFSVMMSILTLSLVGISTGFLLKLMGNIWKELAGMGVTITAAVIDWNVMKSRAATLIDYQAVMIAALSLTLYSWMERRHAK